MKNLKRLVVLSLFFSSLIFYNYSQASCLSCDNINDTGHCYRGAISKKCLDAVYVGDENDCSKIYSDLSKCPPSIGGV